MTTCSRCGANNEVNRAACWDCFAPLTGAIAAKVKPMLLAGHGGVTVEPAQEFAAPAAAKKKGLFGKK
jgi:hypothetical protein